VQLAISDACQGLKAAVIALAVTASFDWQVIDRSARRDPVHRAFGREA
jgi:hypothetical protein